MVGETLGFDTCQIGIGNQTLFGNSFKWLGKSWNLPLSLIAIGQSDPVWKFIQTVREKLWSDTSSIRNWVIRPGLEIHPNGWGKIGIWHLSKHNWVIRAGPEIHPNGQGKIGIRNLSNLNWVIRPGLEILKQLGKNWDLKLLKSQLDNQTRFGNLSKW